MSTNHIPKPPTLYIEGPAFWAPSLPGWDNDRILLRQHARRFGSRGVVF